MATKKALKLREDEYRLMLENGIKTILASQMKMLAELRKLTKALEGQNAKSIRK